METQHYPGAYYNESAEQMRRHFVADVLSAKNAHRTAMWMRARNMPGEFVQHALAYRNRALKGARYWLSQYKAACR